MWEVNCLNKAWRNDVYLLKIQTPCVFVIWSVLKDYVSICLDQGNATVLNIVNLFVMSTEQCIVFYLEQFKHSVFRVGDYAYNYKIQTWCIFVIRSVLYLVQIICQRSYSPEPVSCDNPVLCNMDEIPCSRWSWQGFSSDNLRITRQRCCYTCSNFLILL